MVNDCPLFLTSRKRPLDVFSDLFALGLDLFSEETPCGSILVSDHSVFAILVVAYGRFDCNRYLQDDTGIPFSGNVKHEMTGFVVS